jgi:hypothetical protein
MNLQSLISLLGAGDGEGNTSSMRLVTYAVVLSVLVPAVVCAIESKTGLVITPNNLELLSIVLGAKLVQNQQENTTSKSISAPSGQSILPGTNKPITISSPDSAPVAQVSSAGGAENKP